MNLFIKLDLEVESFFEGFFKSGIGESSLSFLKFEITILGSTWVDVEKLGKEKRENNQNSKGFL